MTTSQRWQALYPKYKGRRVRSIHRPPIHVSEAIISQHAASRHAAPGRFPHCFAPYLRRRFAANIAVCSFHIVAACIHLQDQMRGTVQQGLIIQDGTRCAENRCHVGFDLHPGDRDLFRRQPCLRRRMQAAMSTWELILGSVGAVLLTVYLVYALLRPERF